MEKLELEDRVYQAAKQYLQEIYGNFERIDEQKDKPDAAIRLVQKVDGVDVTIGIEITSVDKQGDLQYFNDEKFGREITQKQIEECIDGRVPSHPMKKSSISMDKDYLYSAIDKKRDRYNSYNESGDFNELIILVFSDFIGCDARYFNDYHVPWTDYLLSQSKFPFDKVIFVDRSQDKCVLIFDKKKPAEHSPQVDPDKELGFTHVQSGFIPFNTTINLKDMFKKEPLVSKKKKRKKN
ncbi:hypothetical protein [Citrobacter arsenatis]|uniref:hypothetical protein n=1 Tax=Citrobacter arsenatis TaxID=2546350 RepID=UPI00300E2147